MTSNYGSLHTHSHFSVLDGMTAVADLVEKAAAMGHPFIGLTDHGGMPGTVAGYKAAAKAGIKFFPGVEGYLIDPKVENWETPERGQKVERFHLGLLARNLDGYHALVRFVSMTHTRPRFNRFPRFTLADLAELGTNHGDDIILTTGCYFGWVQQTLVTQGPDAAAKIIQMYASWFPHTFVELQNHSILHESEGDDDPVLPEYREDDQIVGALANIANDLDLPVIATQDSHYTDQRQRSAHALMKRMTYGGLDDSFPGDSFHLASSEWVAEHYDSGIWEWIEQGYANLIDLHDLSIPPLDNFRNDVPRLTKKPRETFSRAIYDALDSHTENMPAGRQKRYHERLEYEHGVIYDLGMEEYFLIVRDYVRWCEDEGIMVEARGSANGSLICFLLGITQVDPVQWKIDFDRFLSRDRIKAPDIDMDVEDAARPRLMNYLLTKYDAVQIGTFARLGSTYDEREDKETGSVLVSYLSSKRRECEAMAKEWAEKNGKKASEIRPYAMGIFNRRYGDINDIRDVEKVSADDYKALREMSAMKSVYRSYGVHAGGVLLAGQTVTIDDYVPTMLVASSDTRVSQYDMDDVEELGLLKMDILGQATLRTMKLCQSLMGREDPTDLSWIPNDDPEACKLLRSGGKQTTGVFHIEGWTKMKGGRELGVRSTKDAVLVQALYMPGAMESGQTAHYVKARRDREFRESITYVHPIFEKHLKPTYGAYVYQNQVMSILRDLGFDIPSINVFLKVVKDSGSGARERNAIRIKPLKELFDRLWDEHGIDLAEREQTWDALCGFAAYGFNHAHAAGYGIRMYRAAYLKTHYPLEYMTALLQTWAGRDKEKIYVTEARRMGIRLKPPHVNISGELWTMETTRRAIRKGLSSIAGVGATTAAAIAEHAPYESIQQMVDLLPGRAFSGGKKFLETGEMSGIIGKLYDAGALDGLEGEPERE